MHKAHSPGEMGQGQRGPWVPCVLLSGPAEVRAATPSTCHVPCSPRQVAAGDSSPPLTRWWPC